MKKSSFRSPALYTLIVINALVIAFIADFMEHKVIGTYTDYYATKNVYDTTTARE